MKTIAQLQKEVHQLAKDKGWYDGTPRTKLELISLIHAELSEAVEEIRADMPKIYQRIKDYEEFDIHGFRILISKCDLDLFNSNKWHISSHNYLRNSKNEYFHRLIYIDQLEKGKIIDHINRNTLDNRRNNIRIVNKKQNQQNQAPSRNKRYKGVTFNGKKYISQIMHNGKNIYLGSFDNEIDAAKAYDHAAIKYFGVYAYLNFNNEEIKDIIITEESNLWKYGNKVEGPLVELADVVIRIMDMCEYYKWNLQQAIELKHEYNKTRSHRHGGKKY